MACLKPISSTQAPKAVGPYSQAILIPSNKQLIFISGQLPIDLATGQLMDGNIEAQTRCILNYIKVLVEEAGGSIDQIVRVEVFCTRLSDFAAINQEYANFFNGLVPPARQTIQVAALPMGASLEISCMAAIG